MAKKLTISEFKKRMKEIHGHTIRLDESTYISTHRRCRFIDIKYGEWWSNINNVVHQKSHHPLRGKEISRNKRKC